jgi:hypothetical protein
MQRALLIFLVACTAHHGEPAAPQPDAAAVACGGLTETACNAETACFALYSTNGETLPPAGGAYMSCANRPATCTLSSGSSTGGCGYGGVSCPQGLALAFSVTDGDCTKGFSIEGCVHTSACP